MNKEDTPDVVIVNWGNGLRSFYLRLNVYFKPPEKVVWNL